VTSVATTGADAGVPGQTFTLTTGDDFADVAGAYRNSSTTPFDFKFTYGNEIVNGTSVTVDGADTLSDGFTTDADILNIALVGGATGAIVVTNIETINVTASAATDNGAIDLSNVTGAKTLTLTGASAAAITETSIETSGITTVNGSGLTSAVNGLTVDFTGKAGTAALTITGGTAGDALTGASGNDTINGGGGNDTIGGAAGNDTLNGEAGVDTINGGTGNDTIDGGAGNDAGLNGDAGNDIIKGGAGNDTINGGAGKDTITGGAGNDITTLTVDAETDTVIFEATGADNGDDDIVNFLADTAANGGDVLDFTAFLGGAAQFGGQYVAADADTNGVPIGVNANVVVVAGSAIAVTTAAEFTTELAAANDLDELQFAAVAGKYVVMVQSTQDTTAGGATDGLAFYVTTDDNGDVGSVTLVGTLRDTDISTLSAANFA